VAGSFFKFNGHNIFWREGGNPSGSVLLLTHGFPTAFCDWEKIWPYLTQLIDFRPAIHSRRQPALVAEGRDA
jgi:pimeloyl-ACP methyl ester carboxylesterase